MFRRISFALVGVLAVLSQTRSWAQDAIDSVPAEIGYESTPQILPPLGPLSIFSSGYLPTIAGISPALPMPIHNVLAPLIPTMIRPLEERVLVIKKPQAGMVLRHMAGIMFHAASVSTVKQGFDTAMEDHSFFPWMPLFPQGERWEVVGAKPDPIGGGVLYTAVRRPGHPGLNLEGDLEEVYGKLPGLARFLGVEMVKIRDKIAGVSYPDVMGLNVRLSRMPDDLRPPFVFKYYVRPDGRGGQMPLLEFAEYWVLDQVPISISGPLHFHDMSVHVPGYFGFPLELRRLSQAMTKELLDLGQLSSFTPFVIKELRYFLFRNVDLAAADLRYGMQNRDFYRVKGTLERMVDGIALTSRHALEQIDRSLKDDRSQAEFLAPIRERLRPVYSRAMHLRFEDNVTRNQRESRKFANQVIALADRLRR